MENTSHSLGIIPLSLSKLLERFAYYGMRSILILYIIDKLQFPTESANKIYSAFISIIGLLPIIGGLIGDFILSSKTTAIIGGFVQALGCFILAIPSQTAFYIGFSLIALGSGLYAPNLTSMLCSLYKQRIQRLDAAILILYTCINIGAFLGAFIIGTTKDYLGYQFGFIFCGIVMAISQVVLLVSPSLLKDIPKTTNINQTEGKKNTSLGFQIIITIATLFLLSLFWAVLELSATPIYERYLEIQNFSQPFFTFTSYLNPIIVIIGGIILAIIYSFSNSSSLLKISIGFLIFTFSIILIRMCHQNDISTSYILWILFAFLLQSIAELFISPTAFVLICQYGSIKFNATLIATYSALSSLASYGISYLFFHVGKIDNSVSLLICILITIFSSVLFLVFYFLSKQKKTIL